jgi:hypothetical protein
MTFAQNEKMINRIKQRINIIGAVEKKDILAISFRMKYEMALYYLKKRQLETIKKVAKFTEGEQFKEGAL